MKIFFIQLEQVLSDLNIVNPQQVWNCNESGWQDIPKEDEVIGETGVPKYRTVPKGARGDINNSHLC